MHFDKDYIEGYLMSVREAIDKGRCQIAPRAKNKNFVADFVITEDEEWDIIRGLTSMDFSYAEPNDHKGREYETVFIFGKDIKLLERLGDQERTVSLYIKFNKTSDPYLFVISFHEQEYPLSYYFK